MVLTGISGSGIPYWNLIGFDKFLVGKTVTLTCDNAKFGFTSKDFTVNYISSEDGYFVDITGKNFPNPSIGIDIKYGTSILKAKFIVK